MIKYLKNLFCKSNELLADTPIAPSPREYLRVPEILENIEQLKGYDDRYLNWRYEPETVERIKQCISNIKEPTWKLAKSIRNGDWKIVVRGGKIQMEWRHKTGEVISVKYESYGGRLNLPNYIVKGLYCLNIDENDFIVNTLWDKYKEAVNKQKEYERERWSKILDGGE